MGRAAKFSAPDLDSTGIIDRAAEEAGGWDANTRRKAKQWYGRFLELCYDSPGSSPPLLTAEADRLWHTHITFTQQYTNYCNSILGYYLDHIPNVPRRDPLPDEVTAARKAYESKWGQAVARTITPDMIVACKP